MIEPEENSDEIYIATIEDVEEGAIAERFRGYLPVVVDVETGGFNCRTDALLEIAAVPILMTYDGSLVCGETVSCNVEPFAGANVEPASLQFTGIDLDDPQRNAMSENDALSYIYKPIRLLMRQHNCKRAILVAHNAHFDLGFMNAANDRCEVKRNPFHPFSCFDTATLGGLAYGQTVLARACEAAGINFDARSAHSAAYDATKTAELFCRIANQWHYWQNK